MMVVGISTAITLSLCQSMGQQSVLKKQAKTEQSAEGAEKAILIAAPVDVVLTGNYVHLSEITRWVIETISPEEPESETIRITPTIFADCFNTLFKATIISPNAP
jgi:hypothetical protein